MPNEYSGSSPNASAYSTLGSYNSSCYGNNVSAPVPSQAPSMAVQVIPQFSAPGYATLTHDNAPSCGNGYFGLAQAYPAASAGKCTSFAARLCK